VLWHALVIGIFFLPIWRSADEPLPVIATMLFEEPGSSGAAGAGVGGGGENASVTATESRPTTPPIEARPQEAAPSPPETKLAALPEKPKPKPKLAPVPPKPRTKPTPPRAAEPEPVQRADTPSTPAQATPGPASGAGMAANAPSQTGTSGNAGVGRGNEGAGQGALGEGADGPGDAYFERLRRHLKRYQRWPEDSGDKDRGTALVTFTIGRDGTVRAAEIERSSGYATLDEATLDMLRRASPVPPLPSTFRGDQITITIPAEWKRGFFLKKLF
jgi:periplasmic protein TonB